MKLLIVLSLLLLSTLAIVHAQMVNVRLAALIIGDASLGSSAANSAATTLSGYGIPYDLIMIPAGGYSGNFTLEDSATQGRYSVIILADSKTGAITTTQYDQLTAYESKYKARRVIFNQFPGSEWNTAYVESSACCGANVEEYLRWNATTLSANKIIGFNTAANLSTLGLWHYSATITNTGNTFPLLTTPKGVGAVVVHQPNNRAEMVFFIAFADWAITPLLLNHAWVSWGFRDIYIGYRRVYLSTQVDDVFLSTELWDPNLLDTSFNKVYRISGYDLTNHATWANAIRNNRMPSGSNFTLEMVFNGNGVLDQTASNPVQYDQPDGAQDYTFVKPRGTGISYWPANYPTNPVWNNAVLKKDSLYTYMNTTTTAANFFWMSHTFTHLQLNNATTSDVAKEIRYNQMFADFSGIAKRPNIWSGNALVTPAITGLNNSDALAALYANGIRNIVGDNSRNIFNPVNIHWGITTTVASNGFNGMFIIPRSPTEIYFHCSTAAEDLSVYNYVISLNPAFASYATTDFNVLLSREAQRVLRYMLSLRKDSHMFHQANLRVYDNAVVTTTLPNGVRGKFSLLMQWVEYINWQYTQLVSWPIITLKQDDLHKAYLDREARDKCGYNGYANVNITSGIVKNVFVTTNSACTVPVATQTIFTSVPNGALGRREKLNNNDPTTFWIVANGKSNITLSYGSNSIVAW